MKKFLTLFLLMTPLCMMAQGIKISASPGVPDPSAMLEIADTTKGFLPPRMTQTQRNAVSNPALGLMLFNTTNNCLEIWMGAYWKKVACKCDSFPTPAFNFSPASPTTSGPTTFSAVALNTTYAWTFAGGSPSVSTNQSQAVSWGTPGSYQVGLTVTDGTGCQSHKDSLITVSNCVTGGSRTFSSCGASGATGPNQAQCNSTYGPGVVTSQNGIQLWAVPQGICSIRIEAWGAQGGTTTISPTTPGGLGARIRGDFNVTPGTVLAIVVGQAGTGSTTYRTGGGGGSFVWVNNSNTPLIVAGGGGGGGLNSNGNEHGVVAANGQPGTNTSGSYSAGTGGVGGNGGNPGTGGNSLGHSAGGAGWLSNGGGTYPGMAPPNFTGGSGGSTNGGFGGGGGINNSGGAGGGGYSGGGGSGWSTGGPNVNAPGGGGGSFNAGTNQSNAPGVQSGNGQVIISW